MKIELCDLCGKPIKPHEKGGIYTAEHNRNARYPGSFWKLNSKSHYCNPTHWMPLPEPPKEAPHEL